MRYQVTFHALGGGGSIWYDDMSLFLKIPVTMTSSISGGNIRLSFATQIGVNYRVLFKNSLGDTNWQMLSTMTGDGSVKIVSDSLGTGHRFYLVSTE